MKTAELPDAREHCVPVDDLLQLDEYPSGRILIAHVQVANMLLWTMDKAVTKLEEGAQ